MALPNYEKLLSILKDKKKLGVEPCFMTGKACVYRNQINQETNLRLNEKSLCAFSIMPFRTNINAFYRHRLYPFLKNTYKVNVERGDLVAPPVLVMCEGICKKIQAADLITADISLRNANVFYELGLALGIGQTGFLLSYIRSFFGEEMSEYFAKAGCHVFRYGDMESIDPKEVLLQDYLWKIEISQSRNESEIVFYDVHTKAEEIGNQSNIGVDDIIFDIQTHITVAIEVALNKIYQQIEDSDAYENDDNILHFIKGLQKVQTINSDNEFEETKSRIDNSYCLVIRTGNKTCHPMAYFWLGYCHGRGKNVIPVSVIDHAREQIEDYAFDMRSWRYMAFIKANPDLLNEQLHETLSRMILNEFPRRNRNYFWSMVSGKGSSVSIFTGTIHNEMLNLEFIQDWDLRTVTVLTSYLSQNQWRAVIEPPVYSPEFVVDCKKELTYEEYLEQLANILYGKNCIIIGAPNINPITELALGKLHSVPENMLFGKTINDNDYPNAVISLMKFENASPQSNRAFYQEQNIKAGNPKRGFKTNKTEFLSELYNQVDKSQPFDLYAHLVIMSNPFSYKSDNYIILLNGVNGPATFALAQVISGNSMSEEYNHFFINKYDIESEKILGYFLDRNFPNEKGIECIFKIKIGIDKSQSKLYDTRKVIDWELVKMNRI